MAIPFFLIDAFTDTPFAGNPAGVCLLTHPAPDSWMQQVAAEVGASETAFVIDPTRERPTLRWFTPTDEVDLCGHATLAAAFALQHANLAPPNAITFATASGPLTATYMETGIALDFPADPVTEASLPEGLLHACGIAAIPVWTGRSSRDWLIHLPTAHAVHEATPDMEALAAFDTRGVILTAPAEAQDAHDIVSRFFAPRVGVPEDPVTGSAHCALGPYWSQQLNQQTVVGYQTSPRGGTVVVAIPPRNDDGSSRVTLRGTCRLTIEGTLAAHPTSPDAAPPQSSSR